MSDTRRHGTTFFIHIPKTAGMTMNDVLSRQYEPGRSFIISPHEIHVRRSLDAFRVLDPEAQNAFDLIRGHCALVVEGLVAPPKKFIAFLRDPFQQFKSSYYYIRRADWNLQHERVKRMGSLREFLDFQEEVGQDNLQTRHLAGVLEAMAVDQLNDPVRIDDPLFNKAVAWLGRLDHVGLTERFDASLLMLKEGLGWKHHCYYQALNHTERRPDPLLDPDLHERFKEVYKWDLALYALARERFEKDMLAQGEAFQRRVSHFQQRNGIAQYAFRVKNRIKAIAPWLP
ncbi:MAG TPA: hypothetical protein VKG92_09535 [Flavobacteriales bacterium]|nr:hypothetical protein [Flavobacteriales bacterium]